MTLATGPLPLLCLIFAFFDISHAFGVGRPTQQQIIYPPTAAYPTANFTQFGSAIVATPDASRVGIAGIEINTLRFFISFYDTNSTGYYVYNQTIWTATVPNMLQAVGPGVGNPQLGKIPTAMSNDGATVLIASALAIVNGSGQVYVFQLAANGSYLLNQTLSTPDPANLLSRSFGISIAMDPVSSSRLMVSSITTNNNSAGAYLYVYNRTTPAGAGFAPVFSLASSYFHNVTTPGSTYYGDLFGNGLTCVPNMSYCAVSSFLSDAYGHRRGQVWMFSVSASGSLSNPIQFVDTLTQNNSWFVSDQALSADGSILAVGDYATPYPSFYGAAFLYKTSTLVNGTVTGTLMNNTQPWTLTNSPGQGASIGLSTDGLLVAVGAPYDNITTGAGAIYLFTCANSSSCNQTATYKPFGPDFDNPNNVLNMGFAQTLISQDKVTLISGAPSDWPGTISPPQLSIPGVAYVFPNITVPPSPPVSPPAAAPTSTPVAIPVSPPIAPPAFTPSQTQGMTAAIATPITVAVFIAIVIVLYYFCTVSDTVV